MKSNTTGGSYLTDKNIKSSLENILDNITLHQAIRLAEQKVKEGNFLAAKGIYIDIVTRFPGNKKSSNALKIINKNNTTQLDPPLDHYQPIVELYLKRIYGQALSEANSLLSFYPNSIILLSICGATYADMEKFEIALTYYKKAIKINPSYAEGHYHLGRIYNLMANLEASILHYKKAVGLKSNYTLARFSLAISQKLIGHFEASIFNFKYILGVEPDYPKLHFNMADVYLEMGDDELALDCLRAAVSVKPNDVNTLIKAGNILFESARFEDAIDYYGRVLKSDPHNVEVQFNLVKLFNKYVPQKKILNPIGIANNLVRKAYLDFDTTKSISDERLFQLFTECATIIQKFDIKISDKSTQTFLRNTKNLNCSRHKEVFATNKIIPEFCFGCYKVQVEPQSVMELIKLYLIFNFLKLEKNNIRKCMIEMRHYVQGFYKGIIYCQSLEEANTIAEKVSATIPYYTDKRMLVKVKRGCSEYEIEFPDYKKINNVGSQPMNYDLNWKRIEDEHDLKHSKKAKLHINPDVSGLNLNDFFIIQKWLNYAVAVGDQSGEVFKEYLFYNPIIQKKAKLRLQEIKPKS